MAVHQSKKVIYAALVGNSLIAACRFIAAALAGALAMPRKGIRPVAASGDQAMFLHEPETGNSIRFPENRRIFIEAQSWKAHLADQTKEGSAKG